MRHLRSVAIFAAVVLGFGWAGAVSAQEFEVPAAAYQYMYDKINEFRAENGVPKLSASSGPNIVADNFAYYLASTNQADHFADGLGPAGRMDAAAANAKSKQAKAIYKYCGIWENIHHSWTRPGKDDYKTAVDKAMTFWKNSPGHRANMLNPQAKLIGQGIKGWKWGSDYYYKEVTVFVDRSSC